MLKSFKRQATFLGLSLTLCMPGIARADIWHQWLNGLTKAGYQVQAGAAFVTTVSYCKKFVVPLFHTCFNSDASDPYVIPLVPVAGSYIDPYFGQFSSYTLPNGTVVGQDFRLGTNEAVLLVVNLPPTGGYFSYQNYVFSRLKSDYANPGTGYQSPDPARDVMYATYGNSVNNTAISDQSGLGFGGGQVAFISTANSDLIADVTKRFQQVGGNPKLLFPDPMGKNINFGTTSQADDFSILFRYLVPENASAGKKWLKQADINVQVFRITQPASLGTKQFPTDVLRDRSYNVDVSGYASDMTELNNLLSTWLATQESGGNIKAVQANPSMTANSAGTPQTGSVGPFCLEKDRLCFGDQQDAIHWGGYVGPVQNGQLFIVDGVNPASTGNTDVLSLNLENASKSVGLTALSQTNPSATGFNNGGVLTGSAELALKTLGLWNSASPQLQAAAPNLYVHLFTRGCTSAQTYCTASFVSPIPVTQIPYQDNVSVEFRAYGLPNSVTGPNPYYVAAPYVIHD